MNRLRKLADEQLSLDFDERINSFDDYLKMYNENYISDFLLNKYVELASSKDAIDRYIEDCEEPEERVDVLENLNENEILDIDSNIIADNLLNKYKIKFSDNYSKQDFENDVNDYILEKLGYAIVKFVTENISEFLEKEYQEHNSFYYENSAVANELCYIDDSIGEETELRDDIDFDNRIAAFVDLDGEILVSDNGMSHAQLVNEYLEEYDEELNDGWYRPDVREVNEKSGHVNVAFGHIVNDNVWVIEDYTLTDISVEDVVSDIKASGKKYTKIYSYDTSNVTRVAQLEKKMNRLRKLADEQLSLDFDERINSFDDYLKMYNENYISDFLLNKYVELASSKDAIDRYIEGCEEPEGRVDVLENLNGNEILSIDSNIIADNLLNKYKIEFSDNYSKQDFENDVNDYILEKLGYAIVKFVTENISEFLEKEYQEHNSFYYENSAVANKLCYIDDSIGEKTTLKGYIDFDNRIAAFVDLDGEILVSDNGMSHAQLVNEYLEEYDEKLNDDWYRPDKKEISEKIGHVNVAFGHIVNDNVWVIEDCTLIDMSAEDVVSDIKASGKKYTKIYSYDTINVTRVAQLEKQK